MLAHPTAQQPRTVVQAICLSADCSSTVSLSSVRAFPCLAAAARLQRKHIKEPHPTHTKTGRPSAAASHKEHSRRAPPCVGSSVKRPATA